MVKYVTKSISSVEITKFFNAFIKYLMFFF